MRKTVDSPLCIRAKPRISHPKKEDLAMSKKKITRRKFLTITSLGVAGTYVGLQPVCPGR
jgi:hypothetical protein